MSTEVSAIEVRGIAVEVVRKNIKNLHIGVYPPDGRVRVAVPQGFDDEALRHAVASRITWIRKKQRSFQEQARQTEREYATGESLYVWGQRHRLRVVAGDKAEVSLKSKDALLLTAPASYTREQREAVVTGWYREQLKAVVPEVVERWAAAVGVEAPEWRVRRMKTKWGSCNREARRIWLNLELAKKPRECLDYIVVHELAHLVERGHGRPFHALLGSVMPSWATYQAELNRAPLAHERWGPADPKVATEDP